ncbi:MAG: hypothetical protein H0U03_04680 [Actinobacteria bacterium]|nr:hypothetical protein [Actinomycetota bacterium]
MKRLLVLTAAALAAVSIYAVTAPAGQQAVTPKQFAALQKRVTALEKSLKTVRDATNALGTCLVGAAQAVPVGVFGGTATEGYTYRLASGQQVLASALDTLAENEITATTPFMLVTSRDCANAINSGRAIPVLKTEAGAFRPVLHRKR